MKRPAKGCTARPSSKSPGGIKGAKRSVTAAAATKVVTPEAKPLDEEKRRALLAQAARVRGKKRRVSPGQELDDWLAANSELYDEPLLEHQLGHSDT